MGSKTIQLNDQLTKHFLEDGNCINPYDGTVERIDRKGGDVVYWIKYEDGCSESMTCDDVQLHVQLYKDMRNHDRKRNGSVELLKPFDVEEDIAYYFCEENDTPTSIVNKLKNKIEGISIEYITSNPLNIFWYGKMKASVKLRSNTLLQIYKNDSENNEDIELGSSELKGQTSRSYERDRQKINSRRDLSIHMHVEPLKIQKHNKWKILKHVDLDSMNKFIPCEGVVEHIPNNNNQDNRVYHVIFEEYGRKETLTYDELQNGIELYKEWHKNDTTNRIMRVKDARVAYFFSEKDISFKSIAEKIAKKIDCTEQDILQNSFNKMIYGMGICANTIVEAQLPVQVICDDVKELSLRLGGNRSLNDSLPVHEENGEVRPVSNKGNDDDAIERQMIATKRYKKKNKVNLLKHFIDDNANGLLRPFKGSYNLGSRNRIEGEVHEGSEEHSVIRYGNATVTRDVVKEGHNSTLNDCSPVYEGNGEKSIIRNERSTVTRDSEKESRTNTLNVASRSPVNRESDEQYLISNGEVVATRDAMKESHNARLNDGSSTHEESDGQSRHSTFDDSSSVYEEENDIYFVTSNGKATVTRDAVKGGHNGTLNVYSPVHADNGEESVVKNGMSSATRDAEKESHEKKIGQNQQSCSGISLVEKVLRLEHVFGINANFGESLKGRVLVLLDRVGIPSSRWSNIVECIAFIEEEVFLEKSSLPSKITAAESRLKKVLKKRSLPRRSLANSEREMSADRRFSDSNERGPQNRNRNGRKSDISRIGRECYPRSSSIYCRLCFSRAKEKYPNENYEQRIKRCRETSMGSIVRGESICELCWDGYEPDPQNKTTGTKRTKRSERKNGTVCSIQRVSLGYTGGKNCRVCYFKSQNGQNGTTKCNKSRIGCVVCQEPICEDCWDSYDHDPTNRAGKRRKK